MTQCPYFTMSDPHAADPDPAALGLAVGERRTCQRCHLVWEVISTAPYRLAPDDDASLSVLRAIDELGTDEARAKYQPVFGEARTRTAMDGD